jgi:hypothetical protein
MKNIGGLDIPQTPVDKCLQYNWENLERIQKKILSIRNRIIFLSEGGLEIDSDVSSEEFANIAKERRFFGYDLRFKYIEDNSYVHNKQRYMPRSSEEFFYKYESALKQAWFTPISDMEYLGIVDEFREEIYKMDYWWVFPKFRSKLTRFNDISGFHLDVLDQTLQVVHDVIVDFNEFEKSVNDLFDNGLEHECEVKEKAKERVVCTDFFGNDLIAGSVYNFYNSQRSVK